MDINSIIADAVKEDDTDYLEFTPPPLVEDRVLQIDADICAYEVCNLDESFSENKENLKVHLQTLRIMAGAPAANVHLTMGNKGGRYEIATVQEYQGNRKNRDPEQQARVKLLREYMSTMDEPHLTPYKWTDREADDGMSIFQRRRIKDFGIHASVISTVDKDLYMVPGLHMHLKTFDFKEVPDGYGEIWLCRETSTTKVKGIGTSFFFAQLLMGDGADYIPGLPKVSKEHVNRFNPTKAMLEAKTTSARQKIAAKRKASTCGPVFTDTLLRDIKTERAAFDRVLELYTGYYGSGQFTYTDWRGKVRQSTAYEMLLEQGRLLWMHRTLDDDVEDYFNEILSTT